MEEILALIDVQKGFVFLNQKFLLERYYIHIGSSLKNEDLFVLLHMFYYEVGEARKYIHY